MNIINFIFTLFGDTIDKYLVFEWIFLAVFSIQILGKIYSLGIEEYYMRGLNRHWNW